MGANLARLLTDTAVKYGDRPALKLDDTVVTYKMLDEGAARVAGLLKDRGVQAGDRIGVMLPNVPYFGLVYYGVLRAGAVVVPMNVLLKQQEVSFYLSDSGAKQLFVWHGFAAEAEQGAKQAGTDVIVVRPGEFEQLLAGAPLQARDAERDDSDTAVILYTSGTTGTPKGAELTHFNMSENCRVGGTELVDVSEQDVIFGALPLFHSFGQTCCLDTGRRACATMIARFDPAQVLDVIERDRSTVFVGVPTMYEAMLHYPHASGTTSRAWASASRGLGDARRGDARVREGVRRAILEGYGLSETSPSRGSTFYSANASRDRSGPRSTVSR